MTISYKTHLEASRGWYSDTYVTAGNEKLTKFKGTTN